jgi:hypothetical protein
MTKKSSGLLGKSVYNKPSVFGDRGLFIGMQQAAGN